MFTFFVFLVVLGELLMGEVCDLRPLTALSSSQTWSIKWVTEVPNSSVRRNF